MAYILLTEYYYLCNQIWIDQAMYEQHYRGDIIYLMLYASVMVFSLIASCYLLFRRANAIAPNVTSSVRLRRFTAAFLGTITLSYLLYMPLIYLTSIEKIKMIYFLGALFDFLTCFPLVIAILFTMLQDHRRPLWPIGLMMSPLVAGMVVCAITRSDAILQVLYAYFLLLGIGLIIYMVRATRQYGRWLRDNYADLEHKEVWQSLVVLAIIMMAFSLYAYEHLGLFFKYAARINTIILIGFLVWRAETLSDLSQFDSKYVSTNVASETINNGLSSEIQEKIGQLLQQHCVSTQLYLQHDLNSQQLAKAIGTNHFYLSQYFSSRGQHYNDYINELRIQHFISLYHKAIDDNRDFTVQQLAQECGYHSYSTFSRAFKQQTGKNVTTWMGDTDE